MKENKKCPFCGREIKLKAVKCKYCGKTVPPEEKSVCDINDKGSSFPRIIGEINRKVPVRIDYFPGKPFLMFFLMNLGVFISMSIITLGDFRLVFVGLLLGAVGPFITLLLSKFLAKMSFDIKEINPDNPESDKERQIYQLVKILALKAGLPATPEVGIYRSPDINAFATGRSRSNSFVVFSSALVDKMDEESVAAVAAHEIAHIANGDMLSMTIMQGIVNTIIIIIDIALFFALDDDDDGVMAWIVKTAVRWIIVGICMFLANLLLLWFSRHREFKADELASRLLAPESMIKALERLRRDETTEIPEKIRHEQEAYAAFKISDSPAGMDILSTHPAIERRIERLKNIFMNER